MRGYIRHETNLILLGETGPKNLTRVTVMDGVKKFNFFFVVCLAFADRMFRKK